MADSILLTSPRNKHKMRLPTLVVSNAENQGVKRKQTLREIMASSPTSDHLRDLKLKQLSQSSPNRTEKFTVMKGLGNLFDGAKKMI